MSVPFFIYPIILTILLHRSYLYFFSKSPEVALSPILYENSPNDTVVYTNMSIETLEQHFLPSFINEVVHLNKTIKGNDYRIIPISTQLIYDIDFTECLSHLYSYDEIALIIERNLDEQKNYSNFEILLYLINGIRRNSLGNSCNHLLFPKITISDPNEIVSKLNNIFDMYGIPLLELNNKYNDICFLIEHDIEQVRNTIKKSNEDVCGKDCIFVSYEDFVLKCQCKTSMSSKELQLFIDNEVTENEKKKCNLILSDTVKCHLSIVNYFLYFVLVLIGIAFANEFYYKEDLLYCKDGIINLVNSFLNIYIHYVIHFCTGIFYHYFIVFLVIREIIFGFYTRLLAVLLLFIFDIVFWLSVISLNKNDFTLITTGFSIPIIILIKLYFDYIIKEYFISLLLNKAEIAIYVISLPFVMLGYKILNALQKEKIVIQRRLY